MAKLGLLDACLAIIDNEDTKSISVTLFVGGALISGDMIGKIAYYNGLAETLISVNTNDEMDKTKIIGERIKEVIKNSELTNTSRNSGNQKEEKEVYLKNPQFLSPFDSSKIIRLEGGFIVIRYDSIDSFIWGKLSI